VHFVSRYMVEKVYSDVIFATSCRHFVSVDPVYSLSFHPNSLKINIFPNYCLQIVAASAICREYCSMKITLPDLSTFSLFDLSKFLKVFPCFVTVEKEKNLNKMLTLMLSKIFTLFLHFMLFLYYSKSRRYYKDDILPHLYFL